MNENKYYYVKLELTGEIIVIKHGELGFYETDITDDDMLDTANSLNHNTQAEIDAAEVCSMFGEWEKFDERVEVFLEGLGNKKAAINAA